MAQAIRTPPAVCTADGCDERARGYGLCNDHYRETIALGVLLPVVRTFAEAYWQRIDRQPNGCWYWIGEISKQMGYGIFNKKLAHRAVYELLVGPIEPGLDLDHMCHNADPWCDDPTRCLHRRCVNPSHLEPVSRGENVRRGLSLRKTHCRRGHPYDAENGYLNPKGYRRCRACDRILQARYKARRATR